MLKEWPGITDCILAKALGRRTSAEAVQAAIRIREPGVTPSPAENRPDAAEYQYWIFSAYSMRERPAGVSVTLPLLRTRSSAPTDFSSSATFWLTAGWLMPSSFAARVKLPREATVMKTFSLKSSNMEREPVLCKYRKF